jgi:NosR/NirI family nitrous oxide reductase transcriptional regulator
MDGTVAKGKGRRALELLGHLINGRRSLDRILAVLAIGTLLIAWAIGTTHPAKDLTPYLGQALPGASRFDRLKNGMYAGWTGQVDSRQLVGYVAVGMANGYGGPMEVAVGVSPNGDILGLAIVEQRETGPFLAHVLDQNFPQSLIGKSYSDPFVLGQDVQGVTGATYTSTALTEAVRQATAEVVNKELGLSVPPQPPPPLQFGIPEVALVSLYAIGLIGHRRGFKFKKLFRWASLIVGLVIIGFLFDRPLAISKISAFLMGYWPQWQSNLYWFLLMGGILFVFTVDSKNPYCEWFCPFGAAQECLGVIGGAQSRTPRKYRSLLIWLQRGLAWLAVLLALLFRNPGLSSYEVFGTLFDLKGTEIQFLLLVIVLLASLFIRRPWCDFLCPIRPVMDLIQMVRSWIKELWVNRRRRSAA